MAKVYRFEIGGYSSKEGQQFVSHVHYQTDVPVLGSEPSASDVLGYIQSHFSSSGHNMSKWAATIYSSAQLTFARVREEVDPSGTAIPAVAEEVLAINGTAGSLGVDVLPDACCAWLRFGTGVATRSARGGTHTGPTSYAPVLGGDAQIDIATSYWTALNALAASILDPINNVFDSTGDLNPVIYSRTRRGRGISPFTWKLTSVTPSSHLRWLSRRDFRH